MTLFPQKTVGTPLDVLTWHFYPTFATEHYNHKNLPSILWPLIATDPAILLNASVLDQVGHWARKLNAMRVCVVCVVFCVSVRL